MIEGKRFDVNQGQKLEFVMYYLNFLLRWLNIITCCHSVAAFVSLKKVGNPLSALH
jgi:hypothetical protein